MMYHEFEESLQKFEAMQSLQNSDWKKKTFLFATSFVAENTLCQRCYSIADVNAICHIRSSQDLIVATV